MKVGEVWIEKSTGDKFIIKELYVSPTKKTELIGLCRIDCKGHSIKLLAHCCRGEYRTTFLVLYKKEYEV